MRYRGFQNSWWLVLISAVLVAAFGVFYQIFWTDVFTQNEVILIGEALFVLPIILGLIVAKRMTPYYRIRDILGAESFHPTQLLPLMVLPFLLQCFLPIVLLPLQMLFTLLYGQQDPGLDVPQTLGQMIILFGALCILAPILEELLFRGVLMHMLNRYGTWGAILISAASFAMLHFDPANFLVLFGLGVLLGVVRKLTGSVFPCIVIHLANNFVAFLGLIFMDAIVSDTKAVLIGKIVCAVIFPLVMLGYVKLAGGRKALVCEKAQAPFRCSAGFVIMLALFGMVTLSTALTNGILAKGIQKFTEMQQYEAPHSYTDDFYGFGNYGSDDSYPADDDFYGFDEFFWEYR